jgi:UPF0716 family protein affecting phage T7 exclusion
MCAEQPLVGILLACGGSVSSAIALLLLLCLAKAFSWCALIAVSRCCEETEQQAVAYWLTAGFLLLLS